jgi:hypothetical protein
MAMSDLDGISQQLEIRDLGAKGCEVIVTVVNELEETLYVRGGNVEVSKDGKALGRHRLSFNTNGTIELGQFEIAHGRFHIAVEGGAHELHCRAQLDCSRGDGGETRHISQRIKTGTFRRQQ